MANRAPRASKCLDTRIVNWYYLSRARCAGGSVMTSSRTTARRSAVLAALSLVLCGGAATGQDFRGGIAGTVADTSGGVLPGVSVSIANAETGVVQHVV